MEGLADRVQATETITARVARNMVGDEDPVSDMVAIQAFSDLSDLSGDLVTQHERRLFKAIPFHHVAAADAAGPYLDQKLARTYLRSGHLFQAYVLVIVVHRHAHVIFSSKAAGIIRKWIKQEGQPKKLAV
jgi:hypothetical protein